LLFVFWVFFRENLTSGYIKIGDADLSNRPTVYSARNRSSTKIIAIMSIMRSPTSYLPEKKSTIRVSFARKGSHPPA